MPIRFVLIVLLVVCLGAAHAALDQAQPRERRITLSVLEDKIRGGWAGQMIGVSYGAPTEFRSNGKIILGRLPWTPDRVSNALRQDDLYVEMTFAETLDRVGLDASTEQLGEAFKDSKYELWHANAAARRLLHRGIKAPMSGHPKYNIHANDIDFQIEADFIGLMTPGLPQESNKLCDRVGRVMNYGDGLYGGMFVCGMYSASFFERDVRKVVEAGLACIPPASGYGKLIGDVLDWSARYPGNWKKTWQLIEQKWNKDDPCTDGALRPFNIDARLNGAYIALGLLYGKGDFTQTLDVTTRAGQDSDCNPANAAGILGVILGYSNIPGGWKAGIPAIADEKFDYTNSSFNDIVRTTLLRTLKIVEGAGGKVEGQELVIPLQQAQAADLEQWDMGIPNRRIDPLEAPWGWQGTWDEEHYWDADSNGIGARKIAREAGAEATLAFSGVAVALVGPHRQNGGRADVYLDGEKAGEIDAFVVERTNDNDLWHTYDLKPGPHTLRIVTRSDADPRSTGRMITIEKAITYRAR
ncbi:MAG: ADP-ribosylglycohydrolase family protein [Acidobacteriota bacterium]